MDIFAMWSWLHIKWHWSSDDLDLWAIFSGIQACSFIIWIMKLCSFDLDLDQMTMLLKIDLDIADMMMCTENEIPIISGLKL